MVNCVFFFFGVVNDSSKKGLKHERTSKCHPGQCVPYSNVQKGVIFATSNISMGNEDSNCFPKHCRTNNCVVGIFLAKLRYGHDL